MRSIGWVLATLVLIAGGAWGANPVVFGGPAGPPHVLAPNRDACWSEPPDLNGLIASSEIIGQFGLETEIANDLILTTNEVITLARWWGGYYNNNGCADSRVAPMWNLEFFDDDGCLPGNPLAEFVISDYAGETFVYCQGGYYPIFVYEGTVSIPVTANTRYWFVAQAGDHVFPPQVGRVATSQLTGCDSTFRSVYFSYSDWTPIGDNWTFDASQEFECGVVPAGHTTWGTIRGLYR